MGIVDRPEHTRCSGRVGCQILDRVSAGRAGPGRTPGAAPTRSDGQPGSARRQRLTFEPRPQVGLWDPVGDRSELGGRYLGRLVEGDRTNHPQPPQQRAELHRFSQRRGATGSRCSGTNVGRTSEAASSRSARRATPARVASTTGSTSRTRSPQPVSSRHRGLPDARADQRPRSPLPGRGPRRSRRLRPGHRRSAGHGAFDEASEPLLGLGSTDIEVEHVGRHLVKIRRIGDGEQPLGSGAVEAKIEVAQRAHLVGEDARHHQVVDERRVWWRCE